MYSKMLLSLCLIAPFLVQCAKTTNTSAVFESAPPECVNDQIPTHYLVQWKDGSLSREFAFDDREFVERVLPDIKDQIEFAEPEYRVEIPQTARSYNSSPITQSALLSDQQILDNWGVGRIRADTFWKQGVYGRGVKIAVIDSGVDIEHPQLRHQVDFNIGENGLDENGQDKRFNGVDDDKNGYVDDYAGYDFVADSGRVHDYGEHGTHVAGIAVATHTDQEHKETSYVQGVAPEARLIPISFIDSTGGGSILHAVKAIEYARVRGAQIINASWGGRFCSRSLRNAVASLSDQGIAFVAAAGNNGMDIDRFAEYPAKFDFPSVFTVGWSGPGDELDQYSNYGDKHVHIFAPGGDIYSTVPKARYAAFSGTSMAAPMVSGAIALLLSARPESSLADIRQALYRSAVKKSHFRNVSQGRLDLGSTLTQLDLSLSQP